MSTSIKIIIVAVSSILLIRQLTTIIQLIDEFPLNDFSVYLDGTRATLAGQNPYTMWFFDRYNYPPSATIFFVPLTWISQNTAEYIFTSLSIISLWFTITYVLDSLLVKAPWSAKFLLFTLILKLFPVKLTLALGQINLIILALIMASFYFQRRKPSLAGSLLGIAAAIKLTPIPLIVYFIIKKNPRVIISFFITLAIFTFLSILIFGFPLSAYYYTQVLPELNTRVTQTTLNATYMNQSMTALLGRFGIFGLINSLIRYIVSGIMILWICFRLAKTNSSTADLELFSLLLIATTIFLPVFVWQHHYVVIIPLLLVLALRSRWIIAINFYFIFSWYFKNSDPAAVAHPLLSSHFLTATLILLVLNLLHLPPSHNLARKQPKLAN